jgi:hypothetical protein
MKNIFTKVVEFFKALWVKIVGFFSKQPVATEVKAPRKHRKK